MFSIYNLIVIYYYYLDFYLGVTMINIYVTSVVKKRVFY